MRLGSRMRTIRLYTMPVRALCGPIALLATHRKRLATHRNLAPRRRREGSEPDDQQRPRKRSEFVADGVDDEVAVAEAFAGVRAIGHVCSSLAGRGLGCLDKPPENDMRARHSASGSSNLRSGQRVDHRRADISLVVSIRFVEFGLQESLLHEHDGCCETLEFFEHMNQVCTPAREAVGRQGISDATPPDS
jgi:hypothetical protein